MTHDGKQHSPTLLNKRNPFSELYNLTEFVVCVYGPIWFRIKLYSKCTDGPKQLLEQIKLLQLLTPSSEAVAWPVMQRNSYRVHPENLLLPMLGNENQNTRNIVVDRIMKFQEVAECETQIPEFKPSKINENIESLTDLLPPEENCTMEPPITMYLSNEDLEKIRDKPLMVDIQCHSHGV